MFRTRTSSYKKSASVGLIRISSLWFRHLLRIAFGLNFSFDFDFNLCHSAFALLLFITYVVGLFSVFESMLIRAENLEVCFCMTSPAIEKFCDQSAEMSASTV